MRQAKDAAEGKGVRVGGGVSTVQQFLEADLIDTMHVAVAPITIGRGERLWVSHEGSLAPTSTGRSAKMEGSHG